MKKLSGTRIDINPMTTIFLNPDDTGVAFTTANNLDGAQDSIEQYVGRPLRFDDWKRDDSDLDGRRMTSEFEPDEE